MLQILELTFNDYLLDVGTQRSISRLDALLLNEG